jgi:hypothetical protein
LKSWLFTDNFEVSIAEDPKTPIIFPLCLKAHMALDLPTHANRFILPICAAMDGGASSLFQFFVVLSRVFLQKIWGIPNFA